MSDTKQPSRLNALDRRAPNRVAASSVDAYANWLLRSRNVGGRHSAITKNLYNWHNYKNWADKVRGDWDDEEPKG
jgi:hypothetical protein